MAHPGSKPTGAPVPGPPDVIRAAWWPRISGSGFQGSERLERALATPQATGVHPPRLRGAAHMAAALEQLSPRCALTDEEGPTSPTARTDWSLEDTLVEDEYIRSGLERMPEHTPRPKENQEPMAAPQFLQHTRSASSNRWLPRPRNHAARRT